MHCALPIAFLNYQRHQHLVLVYAYTVRRQGDTNLPPTHLRLRKAIEVLVADLTAPLSYLAKEPFPCRFSRVVVHI